MAANPEREKRVEVNNMRSFKLNKLGAPAKTIQVLWMCESAHPFILTHSARNAMTF